MSTEARVEGAPLCPRLDVHSLVHVINKVGGHLGKVEKLLACAHPGRRANDPARRAKRDGVFGAETAICEDYVGATGPARLDSLLVKGCRKVAPT